MDFFTGNSLWYLIRQSDAISKFVLLTLFVMSILCWTVFISKFILLRLRTKDMRSILPAIGRASSINDITRIATQHHQTATGSFLYQTVEIYNALIKARPKQTHHDNEILQYKIDQTVDTFIQNEEAYLPVLSTCAAVSPLLGLFGTVWGLVHAFLRISEKQSADITVVAPGIAEALLTTLAGLVVAIPALIMYNFLSIHVRRLEKQYLDLGDKVSWLMQTITKGE